MIVCVICREYNESHRGLRKAERQILIYKMWGSECICLWGEIEGRYEITLEDAGKIRSYRDIHGEDLTKGEHIMIVCSPNPLYADLAVKTNNSITELYLQYYGSNSIEKAYAIFYCLLNFLVQAREFRKIKNNAGGSWRKRIYVAWKAALYLFTFALLFSLANMIDNFIIGMFIGAMYVLYNMCYLVLHVSRQS